MEEGAWEGSRVERARLGELRGVLNQYMATLLGRRPRMFAYLGSMVG
jgi:hypothetical protein